MKKVEKFYLIKNRHGKQATKRKPQKSIRKQIMQQAYKVVEIFLKQKSSEQVSWQREK